MARVSDGIVTCKGVTVDLSNAEWRTTITADRTGPRVEVTFIGKGDQQIIAVRDGIDPQGQVLLFTPAEWDAFIGGAKDGEFDLTDDTLTS